MSAPGQEKRLVLPGDALAVAEEYEAGEGTYEEGGTVYAAQPGRLTLDAANKLARVVPFNPPAHVEVGAVVYGTVAQIRGSMIEARVLAIHGRDRQVAGELDASLHISKVSNAYTEEPRDAVRLGDIIRARVIQVDPSLQVTTAEANMGVVLAMCTQCRGPMERRGDEVWCPRDERADRRKLAADYGDPELYLPIPHVEEPERAGRSPQRRSDRARGGRRGGGGGRRGGGRGGRGDSRSGRRR